MHCTETSAPAKQKSADINRHGCSELTSSLARVLVRIRPASCAAAAAAAAAVGWGVSGGSRGCASFSSGSWPYFLKWSRQPVQSRAWSLPAWCQSLDAADGGTTEGSVSGDGQTGRATDLP